MIIMMDRRNNNNKEKEKQEQEGGFTEVDLRGYNESPTHMRAKIRMKRILERNGYIVDFEKKMPWIDPETGELKPYKVDVYAYNPITRRTIIVEVDGKIGHSSRKAFKKMPVRDQRILEKYTAVERIFHYSTLWIVGKKKLDQKDFEFEMGLGSPYSTLMLA